MKCLPAFTLYIEYQVHKKVILNLKKKLVIIKIIKKKILQ